jgi:hypothetical protein
MSAHAVFISSRSNSTDETRDGSPESWCKGKPSANGQLSFVFFITSAAIVAIGADGPPDALDPAANHTRIVVIWGGKDGKDQPIVALANPTCTNDPDRLEDTFQGILARELVRQAVLIAARDELGLATRDEVLGDVIAADATAMSDVELAMVFHAAEGKRSPAVIRRGQGASARSLFQRDLGKQSPGARSWQSGRHRRDSVAHRVSHSANATWARG